MDEEKTIAAISTPLGVGGISVIRVSGVNAINIVARCFQGEVNLKKVKPWKVTLGKFIRSNGDKIQTIDHVLVTVFKKPGK